MNSNVPPLLRDLKKEEVANWSFGRIPELNEFDSKGLRDGKRFHRMKRLMCRYNEYLGHDRNYTNPYAVHNMVLSCDIDEYASLAFDLSFPESQGYETMRRAQNQEWAEQRLERGVGFAKEGKLNEALRCYTEAIELVPSFADAYTARGAAYVFHTVVNT